MFGLEAVLHDIIKCFLTFCILSCVCVFSMKYFHQALPPKISYNFLAQVSLEVYYLSLRLKKCVFSLLNIKWQSVAFEPLANPIQLLVYCGKKTFDIAMRIKEVSNIGKHKRY